MVVFCLQGGEGFGITRVVRSTACAMLMIFYVGEGGASGRTVFFQCSACLTYNLDDHPRARMIPNWAFIQVIKL